MNLPSLVWRGMGKAVRSPRKLMVLHVHVLNYSAIATP